MGNLRDIWSADQEGLRRDAATAGSPGELLA
jgi:hypothetical protein